MKVGDEGRDGTEIDIFEKFWLDGRVQHALHWDGYADDHKYESKFVNLPGIMQGWHTFGLHWSPDEYVFDIDGRVTWRTNAGGVSQHGEYIKLSDEVGKGAGKIRRAQLPDRFRVAFVRVYDLVESE